MHFILWRMSELKTNETVQSQLKWYEGIVFYKYQVPEAFIAIIPLNIILRIVRNIFVWIKTGR